MAYFLWMPVYIKKGQTMNYSSPLSASCLYRYSAVTNLVLLIYQNVFRHFGQFKVIRHCPDCYICSNQNSSAISSLRSSKKITQQCSLFFLFTDYDIIHVVSLRGKPVLLITVANHQRFCIGYPLFF